MLSFDSIDSLEDLQGQTHQSDCKPHPCKCLHLSYVSRLLLKTVGRKPALGCKFEV